MFGKFSRFFFEERLRVRSVIPNVSDFPNITCVYFQHSEKPLKIFDPREKYAKNTLIEKILKLINSLSL